MHLIRPTVRGLLLTLTAAALVLGMATPALAHGGGGGTDASNYLSTVTGVSSGGEDGAVADDIVWRVLVNDAILQADNRTSAELRVPGYEGEPYLRIGPDGVFVNRNSPATYQNEDRYAQTPIPDHADADAAPEWDKVSDGSSYGWHDHRIHWMSPTPPPRVRADAGRPQVVNEWEVPFTWNGNDLVVQGILRWVPPPSWWPWVVTAAVTVAAPVAVATAASSGRRRHVLLRTAAMVVAAVLALDVIHAIDDLLAVPATFGEHLYAGLQSATFITVGAFGARSAWRGGDGAATGLAVAAVAMTLGVGLTHIAALTSSQIASVLPDWFARAVTAANLTLLVPTAIAVIGSGDFRMASETEELAADPVAHQP